MRTMTGSCFTIAIALVLSVLMNCSSGGGTGSEVGFICGKLFDTCGNPAKNAKVIIRDNEYLAPVGTGALGKTIRSSGGALCSTYTDGSGSYEFAQGTIDREGIYCIEAWAEDEKNCIFINDIRIETIDYPVWYKIDTPFVHTDRTLRPPASLSGTAFPVHDSTKTFVRVFGLDACVLVGGDGAFRLDSLPQGNHQLQIVTLREEPSYDTIRADVGEGTTTLPDTVIPSVYRVVYYGNGNTAGAAPVDGKWYDDGEKLTVFANSESLTRSGFVFSGWNTREDGSGRMYYNGDTLLKGDRQVSLYAQWAENRYALIVIGIGNGIVTGSDSVAHGIPHTMTALPDAGNNFAVWRVKSGTAIIADSTLPSTTITLKGGDAVVEAVFKPVETFKMVFDGRLNQGATCVRQTDDGGYVMVGSIDRYPDPGKTDVYLVKTRADGEILWTRMYGGVGDDEGYSVQQTNDGGYVIVGSTTSFGAGKGDVYLIRTDPDGDTVWTGTYGGAGEDIGYSVVQADDGGFLFAGYASSFDNGEEDVYIVKVDENGRLIGTGTSGQNHWVKAYSIIRSNDGNYVAVGSAESRYGDGSVEVWLIKINKDGEILWLKDYSGPDFGWGYDVQQTSDGGYVIVGCTQVSIQGGFPVNANEMYLIKADSNGDTLWTKRYKKYSYGTVYSVVPTMDGGYLIGGDYMERVSISYPGFLMKTTPTGEECWNVKFSLMENDYVGAIYTIQQTTDGGFIIAAGRMYLIKTDSNGRVKE